MANIKSQKKRNLQNAKRAQRNKAVKSELRTRVKTAQRAAGTEEGPEALRLAQKRLAAAGAKGIVHKRAASRRISRLMKRVAKASA